ncbi:hypothetical protein NU195Hw_g572t1 [Hortaea werneckii]
MTASLSPSGITCPVFRECLPRLWGCLGMEDEALPGYERSSPSSSFFSADYCLFLPLQLRTSPATARTISSSSESIP